MHSLLGLITDIVYTAVPGPVNVETLRRGMKSGFTDSLAMQTGSSIGRIIYAFLGLWSSSDWVQAWLHDWDNVSFLVSKLDHQEIEL